MRHFKGIVLILAFMFMPGASANSWADLTGPGSISYGNGLYASGDGWASTSTNLMWDVSQQPDGNFEYDYTFTVSPVAGTISHVIIQVPTNFSGTTSGGIIGLYNAGGPGNSNLGMPGSLYGIKFTPATSSTTFSWTIVTGLQPQMGNFYAGDGKEGGGVYAYSGTCNGTTFTGTFSNNVVVPGAITPIPATAWFFGAGLIGFAAIGKKANSI